MGKFEKRYIKDGRCQICGFYWKDHTRTHKKVCKDTVAHELKRK